MPEDLHLRPGPVGTRGTSIVTIGVFFQAAESWSSWETALVLLPGKAAGRSLGCLALEWSTVRRPAYNSRHSNRPEAPPALAVSSTRIIRTGSTSRESVMNMTSYATAAELEWHLPARGAWNVCSDRGGGGDLTIRGAYLSI